MSPGASLRLLASADEDRGARPDPGEQKDQSSRFGDRRGGVGIREVSAFPHAVPMTAKDNARVTIASLRACMVASVRVRVSHGKLQTSRHLENP